MDDNEEKKLIDCMKDGKLTEEGKKLLAEITPNEAKYLRKKYGILFNCDFTLEEVSEQFDVTRKRIKEIEEKALRKLRNNNPDGNGPDAA